MAYQACLILICKKAVIKINFGKEHINASTVFQN